MRNTNRNRFQKLSAVLLSVSTLFSSQDPSRLTVFSVDTDIAPVFLAACTPEKDSAGIYNAAISAEDVCISVSFTDEANIPEGTVVSASEILPDSQQYETFFAASDRALQSSIPECGGPAVALQFARFFDISFTYQEEEIEPEGAVSVEIAYTRPELDCDFGTVVSDVIHLADDQVALMEAEAEQDVARTENEAGEPLNGEETAVSDLMRFETDSFSAYGILFYQVEDHNIGDRLDGMSFALVNWGKTENEANVSTNVPVLLAEYKQESRLAAKAVTVYPESQIDSDTDYFTHYVITDTDVTEWNFTWIENNDYYITAEVNGVTKYLSIYTERVNDGGRVELQDAPDEWSVITVQNNGTDASMNKLRFVNKEYYALNLKGKNINNGYQSYGPRVTSTEWTEWFVPAVLTDASLSGGSTATQQTQTAIKFSVSDTVNLVQDAEVVVYSKVWNPETNKYDNYAIDGSGNLVKVWESGSVIQWVDAETSSLYWQFIQYGSSGYYEFYNPVTGMYLAPQNGQILSNSTIGVTLSGRENGEYTSTVEAWDGNVWGWYGYRYSDDLTLIPAPDTQSAQMCFAVKKEEDAFHPVETVDSKAAGITIKMYDYSDTDLSGGDRNRLQTQIIGESAFTGDGMGARTGLVDNVLVNGFPVATKTNLSLEPLFSANADYPEREANHLFLKSTYEETGYYEYSCFDNSAFLMHEDGTGDSGSAEGYEGVHDFTVYQELVTPGAGINKNSSFRGNFLPYDEPDADDNTTTYHNLYDEELNPMSAENPRYNEPLYNQTQAGTNYFFGMSIESTFMIPENGCDANGNPLIFEFTGDDDFWLFIDGVLVMDLGGIHNALNGKINFQTGEVSTYNGYTANTYTVRTMLDCFREAGVFPDGSSWDESLVSDYFKNDGSFVSSEGVFKDYSSHSMKIFYMERGKGASNLRLRFNLAVVPEDSVFLEKKLTGTQTTDYSNTKYAYQLYYKPEGSDAFALYENPADEEKQPHYEKQNRKIEYAASAEINGMVYEHVYYLRAGEAAEFTLPNKQAEYYFKELGVFNQEYDYVNINNERAYTSDYAATQVQQYTDVASSADVVSSRKRVIYENHIDSDYLKSLTITKRVVDKDGNPVEDDKTGFEFQLNFLDADGVPVPYRKGEYYVIDSEGYYYEYVNGQLSKHGSEKVVCSVSGNNGSIAGIPDGFSVVIENLLPTTAFMTEEQEIKIPLGYQLVGYEAEAETYNLIAGEDVNYGIIRENISAHLTVVNQKGFGITVNKDWKDQDYTASHETIYIALFHKEPDNSLLFVEGTFRELIAPNTSVYYFNDEEEASEYLALEVNPETVQPAGWGGDPAAVTECQPYPANTEISLQAQTLGGNEYTYDYVVSYTEGEIGGTGHNVRTDTIVNSRDFLRIVKQSTSGDPLSGAVFTLKDTTTGEDLGTFASDAEGVVTNAYFTAGHSYQLEEISAPRGFEPLSGPITVDVDSDNRLSISFSADDADLIETEYGTGQKSGTLTIKDKHESLILRKVSEEGEPLCGGEFSLYQFDKAQSRKYLISGMQNLVSDENGIFLGESLRTGYYLLEETAPPNGYAKPDYEIVFHVRLTDGAIDQLYSVRYNDETNVYDKIEDLPADLIVSDQYGSSINIPNETITSSIVIRKTVDSVDFSKGTPAFMFRITQTKDENGNAVESGAEYVRSITFEASDADSFKEVVLDDLPVGSYIVEELSARNYVPAGLTVTGDDHAIISSYMSATVALTSPDAVTVAFLNCLDDDAAPCYTAFADNRIRYTASQDPGS